MKDFYNYVAIKAHSKGFISPLDGISSCVLLSERKVKKKCRYLESNLGLVGHNDLY